VEGAAEKLWCSGGVVGEEEAAEGELLLKTKTGTWLRGRNRNGSGATLLPCSSNRPPPVRPCSSPSLASGAAAWP
jgi:hypothetical protein